MVCGLVGQDGDKAQRSGSPTDVQSIASTGLATPNPKPSDLHPKP